MRKLLLLLCAIFLMLSARSQQKVAIRNLWARPEVHITYNGYKLAFTIRDIDKTLGFLREAGDIAAPPTCELDTGRDYFYEIATGLHPEYQYPIQEVMHTLAGAYLLNLGHVVIIAPGRKKPLKEIIVNFSATEPGEEKALVTFYDPANRAIIFQGWLNMAIYKRDLGIWD
jgi:hypothetical protein